MQCNGKGEWWHCGANYALFAANPPEVTAQGLHRCKRPEHAVNPERGGVLKAWVAQRRNEPGEVRQVRQLVIAAARHSSTQNKLQRFTCSQTTEHVGGSGPAYAVGYFAANGVPTCSINRTVAMTTTVAIVQVNT